MVKYVDINLLIIYNDISFAQRLYGKSNCAKSPVKVGIEILFLISDSV